MVLVAQSAELSVVVRAVTGSTPVEHPIKSVFLKILAILSDRLK